MKKLAVALSAAAAAILVSGMANAAEIYNKDGNKLDLYGKVDARHQFSSPETLLTVRCRRLIHSAPAMTGSEHCRQWAKLKNG